MRARLIALKLFAAVVLLTSSGAADTPAPARAETPGSGPLQRFVLPNKLEVFVQEDHRHPAVTIDMAYRVGERDDPPDRQGMASLFRSLLERPSTRHLPEFSRPNVFQALGGHRYFLGTVQATLDDTHVVIQVPPSATELALYLTADRMGFATDGFESFSIDSAVRDVRSRWSRTPKNIFGHIMMVAEREVVGPNHPYARPLADLPLMLEGITQREVLERYRNFYGPGNAALFVHGDIDAARVRQQVEQYFGPLLPSPRAPAHTRAVPTMTGEKRIAMESDAVRPLMYLMWPTAPMYSEDDVVLDVVAGLLRKRLQDKLVVERKLAAAAYARQASRGLASVFFMWASVADGHDTHEVRRAMEDELRLLVTTGPTAAEAAIAAAPFATSSALDYVNSKGHARKELECHFFVGDTGCFDKYLANYVAITPKDVQRVVGKYLQSPNRVVVALTPNKDAPAEGRIVGEKKP